MITESITASEKSVAPSVQARLPSEQEATKDKEVQKSVQRESMPDLDELAADMQNNLNIIHNVDLQFSVQKSSGKVMVTVTDEESGEVIREIPSEELVKFANKFDEMVGMLFDRTG